MWSGLFKQKVEQTEGADVLRFGERASLQAEKKKSRPQNGIILRMFEIIREL